MGPILDRTIEHLGTSDLMIIQVRRRLLEAVHDWVEHKSQPPALDVPESYGVRCGGVFLPEGTNLIESIQDLLKPFVEHPELNPTSSGA
jgi:hypothetical protein